MCLLVLHFHWIICTYYINYGPLLNDEYYMLNLCIRTRVFHPCLPTFLSKPLAILASMVFNTAPNSLHLMGTAIHRRGRLVGTNIKLRKTNGGVSSTCAIGPLQHIHHLKVADIDAHPSSGPSRLSLSPYLRRLLADRPQQPRRCKSSRRFGCWNIDCGG